MKGCKGCKTRERLKDECLNKYMILKGNAIYICPCQKCLVKMICVQWCELQEKHFQLFIDKMSYEYKVFKEPKYKEWLNKTYGTFTRIETT